jgi:hypothetical protein
MARATRAALIAAGCALMLSFWSARTTAQTPTPPAKAPPLPTIENEWRFKVTPYFWLAGLTGQVGVGPLQTSASISPGEVLRHLQFGAMANGEARKGPWAGNLDIFYVSTGANAVVIARGDTGSATLKTHLTMVQPMVGYTLGDPTYGVDLLFGGRFWRSRPVLTVDRPNGQSIDRSISKTWGDPVIGVRAHATIPQYRIRLIGYVDGGGAAYSGSHGTWQAYGTAGYQLASNWTASVGFRTLSVDYQPDNLLFHPRFRGFLAAATFSW